MTGVTTWPEPEELAPRATATGTWTTTQRRTIVAALVFLAASAGYFVGTRPARAPSTSSVSVGFLQDMINHHEQAIQMANIELVNGTEPAVEVFAREIVYFQGYEIGMMERRLAEWGLNRESRPAVAMTWMGMPSAVATMPGMASPGDLARLQASRGRDADALFVKLMKAHHQGGVHMADYASARAGDRFVRDLATRIARNQRLEIAELESARVRTGLPVPP